MLYYVGAIWLLFWLLSSTRVATTQIILGKTLSEVM